MSAARLFALGAVLALSACSGGTGSSSVCAQPMIAVSPDPVASGAMLQVDGQAWVTGCDDNSVREREVPVDGIRIELITAGSSKLLGIASASGDAGTMGQFTVSLPVPDDTGGSATVRASGDGLTAEADVTVRSTR
jgi:hypothetical protein